MSTVNTMPNSETPPKLPEPGEPKFTAEQIERDCPARLQQIGREIAERLKKAEKQAKFAADQLIAVDQLVAEAKGLCDGGGFNKFRELLCPQLGKSQAYALLAIAAGKKTLAEHRTAERERKQKSRANQRTAAANSGTVPEKSKQQDAPTEASVVGHSSAAVEQPPVKPWRERASVEGMRVFTAHSTGLDKVIKKRPPAHFSETAVSVEIIEHLARFYTGLAKLMSAKAAKPTPVAVLSGNGAASNEQSAVAADQVA